MQITEILAQMGGLKSMAQELGINESQAASGAEALGPAILGGLKKQAQSQPEGPEGLSGMLEQLGGGSLLDDVLAPQPTSVSRGNDVLGQIFGSKDVSRAVAQNAASQSGIDSSLLKKMLPMLTMLVTGFMAKQGGSSASQSSMEGGGLGDLIGGLFGSRKTGNPASGLASLIDLDGDGNSLDDILEMVRKGMRQ